MRTRRFFTPAEAAALVPRLRPLLTDLRDAFHDYRFAKAQHDELARDYGEDPAEIEGHPEQAEGRRWRDEALRGRDRVDAILAELDELGVEVKDPLLGLVDFYAERDGETVLLCFRDDEPTLAYWHPLTTGFSGRRPLSEF